jgi:hypothetical protein
MRDLLSRQQPHPVFSEVAILRLPCVKSWKIPLYLDVGPSDPAGRSLGQEIGVQKHWYERFGAELCCAGDDFWQFRVARPTRDHAAAMELLREHYLYEWIDGAYEAEALANGAAQLRVDTHWRFFSANAV